MEMQRPGHVLHTVGPCDICGDFGYSEVIVSCMKCNINCEHIYCMRINMTRFPDDWICEPCESKTGKTPYRVNLDFVPQPSKRQRSVMTGKVKFLPEDEAIKLSSGNFSMKHIPANSNLPINRKTSAGYRNVISKTPSLTIKPNPKILPKALVKRPRNGEVNKSPMNNRHVSGTLSKGPTREQEHIRENQPLGSVISNEKDQTLDPQKEKPIVGSGGMHGAVAECNRSIVERSNLHCIREDFNCHHKLLPSSVIPWSGQFQILHPAAFGEFYDGFEAQPPCLVSSKAYECSRKMPTILQLEPLPALTILLDLFQDDPPGLEDIALYFFPSEHTKRSREKLDSILKIMNAEKLMFRSIIDGVELLMFASDELDMDSQSTIAAIKAGCFLWGVFRQKKIHKAIERSPEMEPVDMDIDMIGGKDVLERVDHVNVNKVEKKTSSLDIVVVPPGFEAGAGTTVEELLMVNDRSAVPPGFQAHAAITVKVEKRTTND